MHLLYDSGAMVVRFICILSLSCDNNLNYEANLRW